MTYFVREEKDEKTTTLLTKLELYKINYTIEHNRDDYIMVLVAIPGELWEVEFDAEDNVEIEIFKNSTGVYSDERMLDRLFKIETKCSE